MVDVKEAVEDSQAVDDKSNESSPTLETKIAAKQAALLAGTTVNVEDEKPEDDSQITPTPVDDEVGEEEEDTTILPAGHRRAALARGWTAEEIDHFLETKPEEAVVQFRETFDKWQEESSKWSARGRVLLAAKPEDKKKDSDSSPLSEFDADALIAAHGNEEFIQAIIGPLNKMVGEINTATGRLSQSEKGVTDSRVAALLIEAQTFLTSKVMKPYEDVYGVEPKDLSTSQFENRMQLFEEADIIVAGAKAHGQTVSASDALARAHASMSQDTRDVGIRAEIRESMKKRTKTSRGSRQRSAPADKENEPISPEELEKRTAERLKALREK